MRQNHHARPCADARKTPIFKRVEQHPHHFAHSTYRQTRFLPLMMALTNKGFLMVIRRRRLLGAATCGALAPALVACSSDKSEQEAAHALRQSAALIRGDAAALRRELVRYATLAPSSHNTQCWRFQIQDQAIIITPDMSRRTPVVDPDDHHLFVSLGCATENLAQAALANGFKTSVLLDTNGSITCGLEPTKAMTSPLFRAIADRQCTRADYDGKSLTNDELRLLERAGTGDGVSVRLLTAKPAMESALEHVVAGNTTQMNDAAFVRELKSWIRFSADEALRTGDGLFSGTTDNPAVPRWLGSPMMSLLYSPKSENEKIARQIRSSAGLAVFVSEQNKQAHWVEAGRCYERFALQATALGIRNAMLNQAVEVPAVRAQFASWLGLQATEQRPDLVVRFGRGPVAPLSMRRPVQAVLI